MKASNSRSKPDEQQSFDEFDPQAIMDRTAEIETQKAEKKRLRKQRALEKAANLRRQKREKLVAPVLLIITVIIALLMQLAFSR